MIRRLAVIAPARKRDYLVDTILDGLDVLRQAGEIESFLVSAGYPANPRVAAAVARPELFTPYAAAADAILLCWGKNNTNWKLAEALDCWHKTAFVEGSEPGGDLRFDVRVQRAILEGSSRTEGAVLPEMMRRCVAYFRREKPILPGIDPLPFGIERRYQAAYQAGARKDIDFFCIFGQDKHPLLRREVTRDVRRYCEAEGFTCVTDKVAPDQFYQLLARSKVGVSVGGGGYDTARFWEILGNNCLLLTERIDLLPPRGTTLSFKRIFEFGSLFDFAVLLPQIGKQLREAYDEATLQEEHHQILAQHNSASRARQILATLTPRLARP